VLDCARDADCEVEFRRHGLAGLADLRTVTDPAGVDYRTRSTDRRLATERCTELLEQREVLRITETATTCDHDSGLGDVDRLLLGAADSGDGEPTSEFRHSNRLHGARLARRHRLVGGGSHRDHCNAGEIDSLDRLASVHRASNPHRITLDAYGGDIHPAGTADTRGDAR